MLSLRPLDPLVPIEQQLQSVATPVVLINLFTVAETDIPSLMVAWEKDANWMKLQPGYISKRWPRKIGQGDKLIPTDRRTGFYGQGYEAAVFG